MSASGPTSFVLVHGAFRGGWAWDLVRRELDEAGIASSAPTLTGCEPSSPRVGTHVRLQEWVDDVIGAVTAAAATGTRVILVAHSQAGLPVRAALETCWPSVAAVVYLDAAVPRDGERGVDLNPPGVPSPPGDLDPALWIPARAVGPEQGFDDPALAAFVNERLVPTPLGPSLDAVRLTNVEAAATASTFVFFDATPPSYPCTLTRLRLDEEATPYTVLPGGHDAPVTAAAMVAGHLVALV
jgi:pimeloyl-ACP methyl ester carboxylesterase